MQLRASPSVTGLVALGLFYQATSLPLELHVNAFLRGGKRYNHTGLIRHRGGFSSTTSSYAAHASGTHVIMTVEILKMLQIVNLAVSGSAGNPNLTYRQSFYFNRIVFGVVGECGWGGGRGGGGWGGGGGGGGGCIRVRLMSS